MNFRKELAQAGIRLRLYLDVDHDTPTLDPLVKQALTRDKPVVIAWLALETLLPSPPGFSERERDGLEALERRLTVTLRAAQDREEWIEERIALATEATVIPSQETPQEAPGAAAVPIWGLTAGSARVVRLNQWKPSDGPLSHVACDRGEWQEAPAQYRVKSAG